MTDSTVKLTQSKARRSSWYYPTISPQHGVYVVLIVSFLIGAAAAQTWTWTTTLALLCAFCGFQAEHPLVLQIRQRSSLKPRFLLWGGLYGSAAIAIALYLYLQHSILLWIYAGAIVALLLDAVAVLNRDQKSILNELITFAAVCLSTPFAYAATTGRISPLVLGLWVLNTLFFGSAIFSVKLRKPKTSSLTPGVIYHAIATLITIALYSSGVLPLAATLAFGIVLLKFGWIGWQQAWYRTASIRTIALLETFSAFGFLSIVALSVLPARLTDL